MRNANLIAVTILLSVVLAVAGAMAGSGMVTVVTDKLHNTLNVLDNR